METSTLHILAVGRDHEILLVVQRLINSHENWAAKIVTTDEAAVAAFGQQRYPIVFVCAGVTTEEEEALKQRLSAIDASVTVIRHFGGGSGLLENEVRAILDQKGIRILNA
jgi:hypothetical protein